MAGKTRNKRQRRKTRRVRRHKLISGGQQLKPEGFIMVRYVKNKEHNRLYQECYACIRKFHPSTPILIIDDNSDKSVLEEIPMENVEVIASEFPGAGEYLPYYYMLKKRPFQKAFFIQDSMFLNTPIDFNKVNEYAFHYSFNKAPLCEPQALELLNACKRKDELIEFYKNGSWKGCWGSMMTITLSTLDKLETEFQFTNLVSILRTRDHRIAWECVSAIMCQLVYKEPVHVMFGTHEEMQVSREGLGGTYNFDMYIQNKTRIKNSIIKIWNGR
jgi:hypothetical protein